MAKSRPFQVQIWEDKDFQEYTISEKLVFIYLFTGEKVTQSGVYHCTIKTISNATDVNKGAVERALTETFDGKVLFDSKTSVIWVKNFLRYNFYWKRPQFLMRSIINDYNDKKVDAIWDNFWEYNGALIGKIIKKSSYLQKDLSEKKIILPGNLVKINPMLELYLSNA